MIDWNRTKTSKEYFNKYPKTRKEVLRICDECNNEKWIRFCNYSNLCITCSNKKRLGIKFSDETCQKMSEMRKGENNPFYGKKHSEGSKQRNREAHLGKPSPMKNKHHSNETKDKISKSRKGKYCGKNNHNYKKIGNKNPLYAIPKSDEHKILISCTKQGIKRNEWTGFLTKQSYCYLWTESFRELIRNRFYNKCYLCNKSKKNNNQKLSVHHVNYDKNCLCNGGCEFVPLCKICHAKTNGNRQYYEDLIMCYLYPKRYFMIEI